MDIGLMIRGKDQPDRKLMELFFIHTDPYFELPFDGGLDYLTSDLIPDYYYGDLNYTYFYILNRTLKVL